MSIVLPPGIARRVGEMARTRKLGSQERAAGELILERVPRGTRRLESSRLEDRVARELAQLEAMNRRGQVRSPDELSESGGWRSPVDVEFAIDTVRRVKESGVSPAESVDLDRVIALLQHLIC